MPILVSVVCNPQLQGREPVTESRPNRAGSNFRKREAQFPYFNLPCCGERFQLWCPTLVFFTMRILCVAPTIGLLSFFFGEYMTSSSREVLH